LFGGLSIEEAGKALGGVSGGRLPELEVPRAWLRDALEK
jgi:hypothetical protein